MDISVILVLSQSTPQIKARLPSSATACYALAVSSDGKVHVCNLQPAVSFKACQVQAKIVQYTWVPVFNRCNSELPQATVM